MGDNYCQHSLHSTQNGYIEVSRHTYQEWQEERGEIMTSIPLRKYRNLSYFLMSEVNKRGTCCSVGGNRFEQGSVCVWVCE